jgi:hypothetical protein
MKVSIDIDQVLTCATEILASPGDRLMVLNGTVIGVMPPDPFPGQTPRDPSEERIGGYYTSSQVVELFRTHGPASVNAINRKLSHGPEMRLCVKRAVQRLLKEGRLIKLNDSRFGIYAVPPTN